MGNDEPEVGNAPETLQLKDPCLIAVWPGMGNVALSAGYYMMSKLGMQQIAEFPAEGLYDVDNVLVRDGVILKPQRPRSRLFGWRSPDGHGQDVIMFIGEAQPPLGKYAFCERLINYATSLGAKKVFTFAAMGTAMHPARESRVFAAATSLDLIAPLTKLGVEVLEEANIGGMNGVLLGVAAEKELPGVCLLGEMPHFFANLPFPKASMMVLKVFATICKIRLDLTELAEQSDEIEQQLGELLEEIRASQQAEPTASPQVAESAEDEYPRPEGSLAPEEDELIERLFQEATVDHSKAYELKRELDRLGVFDRFEDRFLDLFKKKD